MKGLAKELPVFLFIMADCVSRGGSRRGRGLGFCRQGLLVFWGWWRGRGRRDGYARLSNAGNRKNINTRNQPKNNAGRAMILWIRTEQQNCFGGIFGVIFFNTDYKSI